VVSEGQPEADSCKGYPVLKKQKESQTREGESGRYNRSCQACRPMGGVQGSEGKNDVTRGALNGGASRKTITKWRGTDNLTGEILENIKFKETPKASPNYLVKKAVQTVLKQKEIQGKGGNIRGVGDFRQETPKKFSSHWLGCTENSTKAKEHCRTAQRGGESSGRVMLSVDESRGAGTRGGQRLGDLL